MKFIPGLSVTEASWRAFENTELKNVARMQAEEDTKLFGCRDIPAEHADQDISIRSLEVLDTSGDVQMLDADHEQPSERDDQHPDMSLPSEPPIYSWLANTSPPEDPDSVMQWRQCEEDRRAAQVTQEMDSVEIFRNVQVAVSGETGSKTKVVKSTSQHKDVADLGSHIDYRNIVDRYPSVEHYLARRLAEANWKRAKRLVAFRDSQTNGLG